MTRALEALLIGALALGGCGGAVAPHAPPVSTGRVVVGLDHWAYVEQRVTVRDHRATIALPRDQPEIFDRLTVVEASSRAAIPVQVTREHDRAVITIDARSAVDEVMIGYVVATPAWKPVYMLIEVGDGFHLRGFGLIENWTGVDWRDITLQIAPVAHGRSASDRPGHDVLASSNGAVTVHDQEESSLTFLEERAVPATVEGRTFRMSNPTELSLPPGRLDWYRNNAFGGETKAPAIGPHQEVVVPW